MQLHIKVAFLKQFEGDRFAKLVRYRDDDKFVDLDADIFSATQLDKLIEMAKANPKGEGSRGLLQKIAAYRNIGPSDRTASSHRHSDHA